MKTTNEAKDKNNCYAIDSNKSEVQDENKFYTIDSKKNEVQDENKFYTIDSNKSEVRDDNVTALNCDNVNVLDNKMMFRRRASAHQWSKAHTAAPPPNKSKAKS
jgi:hypothetical protein